MYYGEEIGMTNVAIAPEDVKDPTGKKTSRASGWAVILSARPCNGTVLRAPALQPRSPGFLWLPISKKTTLQPIGTTTPLFSICIDVSLL